MAIVELSLSRYGSFVSCSHNYSAMCLSHYSRNAKWTDGGDGLFCGLRGINVTKSTALHSYYALVIRDVMHFIKN